MKKVLVTGGAGFIGSHLVEKLIDKGCKVVVLDNLLRGNKIRAKFLKKIKIIKGDIRNKKILRKAIKGVDIVFHLAAFLGVDEVASNPYETMNVEVIGTSNLVELSLEYKIKKIIYISTSGVYGKTEIEKSVKENFNVSPVSSYAIAKRFNEIYLQSISKNNSIITFSLRYFNVYGPRQDKRMVVPRFIEQAKNNKNIVVHGNGLQTRDFTYIDDVIFATIRIAEKLNKSEILNIARGKETNMIDLAKSIKKILNSKSSIKKIKVPSHRKEFDVERRLGNSSKLYKLINFRPKRSLNEGIREIIKYNEEL